MSQNCKVTGEPTCKCIGDSQPIYKPIPKETMRKLWEDHVIGTKFVINTLIDNKSGSTPEFQALLPVAMQNAVDIGTETGKYIGKKNGIEMGVRMKTHIECVGDMITKIATGQKAESSKKKAYENGAEFSNYLVQFLSYNGDKLRENFNHHIEYYYEIAYLRQQKNYTDEIKKFDALVTHMLAFSDLIYYQVSSISK